MRLMGANHGLTNATLFAAAIAMLTSFVQFFTNAGYAMVAYFGVIILLGAALLCGARGQDMVARTLGIASLGLALVIGVAMRAIAPLALRDDVTFAMLSIAIPLSAVLVLNEFRLRESTVQLLAASTATGGVPHTVSTLPDMAGVNPTDTQPTMPSPGSEPSIAPPQFQPGTDAGRPQRYVPVWSDNLKVLSVLAVATILGLNVLLFLFAPLGGFDLNTGFLLVVSGLAVYLYNRWANWAVIPLVVVAFLSFVLVYGETVVSVVGSLNAFQDPAAVDDGHAGLRYVLGFIALLVFLVERIVRGITLFWVNRRDPLAPAPPPPAT